MTLFSILFCVVISFQLFYLLMSIKKIFTKKKPIYSGKIKPVTIIIPIFNGEKTISKCLDSILLNDQTLIKQIIIVFDHCTDNSFIIVNKFKNLFLKNKVKFNTYELEDKTGKVEGLLEGLRHTTTEHALIMDSDIVLKPNAVKSLLLFHKQKNNPYSSCFIYPYAENKNSLLNIIIDNDRLYRQNILQNVRNDYKMANFPGGIGVIDTLKYKQKLKSGFLEDLTATYKIIENGEKVDILAKPLAFEIERKSIKGVILQRTRWTIGNIENMKNLLKTINKHKKITGKILLSSYPIMWYLQHYLITIGIVLFIISGFKLIFLIPQFLYFLEISISSYIGRKDYQNNFFGIVVHSLIYPVIIFISLLSAVFLIIKNKKMFFKKESFFARI